MQAKGLPVSPSRPTTPRYVARYGKLLQVPSRYRGATASLHAIRRRQATSPKENNLAEAAVSTAWCDRSLRARPKAPEATAIQIRAAKHRQALHNSISYHAAAVKIQKRWRRCPPRRVALLRLIYHEARKRHQQRDSYKARMQLFPETYKSKDSKLPEASIWQLMQCPSVLREALQDIRHATKLCATADGSVRLLSVLSKASAEKRSWLRDLRRRTWVKLTAVAAMTSMLEAQRSAEVEWTSLRRCIMTPREGLHTKEAPDFGLPCKV